MIEDRTETIYVGDMEIQVNKVWEVCPECEGEGKHSNPAFDGVNVNDLDQETLDNYMAGLYDIQCQVCKGRTTILVNDLTVLSDHQLETYEKEQAQYRLETYWAERERMAELGNPY